MLQWKNLWVSSEPCKNLFSFFEEIPVAEIEAIIPHSPTGTKDLRYSLSFTESGQRFELVDERLEAEFYQGVEDFDINVEGGTVQLFLQEGDYTIPATRLSDGTIRYICLLAILCHPKPPPLICIEEPELGIHTDILPQLATLMKEASTRTQLFITTHSDVLVDELTDMPDSILVCAKEIGNTSMKRLDAGQLKNWLKKYNLGELWRKGEIGGNRW